PGAQRLPTSPDADCAPRSLRWLPVTHSHGVCRANIRAASGGLLRVHQEGMTSVAQMLTIRKGMDVYNADQSRYIGTVVRIKHGEQTPTSGSGPIETGSSREAVEGNPELVHEEGHAVSPTAPVAEQRLGEEMGPVPTI